MWKFLLLLAFSALSCKFLNAQALNKSANNAFVLTRMVEKFHVQPRALNDELSSNIFFEFLKEIDEQKIFFTAEDVKFLSSYQYKLDDEIKAKQTNFLQSVAALFQKRLLQSDTMIDNICKTPFNFTLPEKLTVAEDTSYAANVEAVRSKLYKLIKASVLEAIIENDDLASASAVKQKIYVDSIEPVLRHKIQNIYKRSIKRMLQGPGGIQQAIGDEFCKAIAVCYDPHTAYFPLSEKENFESELGQKSMAFGFGLDEDEDGNVMIENLKPGSPAFKSGQINKGDKIESVQWEGKEPIDVKGARLQEISQTLSLSNHDKAVLKIRKSDGTSRDITLWKEKMEDDEDEGKVKSFLLKGSKTIGYLSLPAFYEDWESDKGINGCANDVAKEIVKLKKENIDGLILDVR